MQIANVNCVVCGDRGKTINHIIIECCDQSHYNRMLQKWVRLETTECRR